MAEEINAEKEKRKVERELDRQLEDTFPASDPLKITRHPPEKPLRGYRQCISGNVAR